MTTKTGRLATRCTVRERGEILKRQAGTADSQRHSALVLILSLVFASPLPAQSPRLIPIRITTSVGVIDAVLDSTHAPRTTVNFLHYIDAAAFRDGQFHRTVTLVNQPDNAVKIEVIQGAVGATNQHLDVPPIELERTSVTGLHHTDGTLSMARAGPNTATSSFFICIGAQPTLDFNGPRNADGQGFAAFGEVTSGMDVVRDIQRSPASGQTLTPPIRILGIIRR